MLPMELAMAKRDVERLFGPTESGRGSRGPSASSEVVQDVLDAVARWLVRV